MSEASIAALSAVGLFIGVLLFLEGGIRLGRAQSRRAGGSLEGGTGVIDTAVLALLGLLIGFTFNGAYARMDAIGTAYLRLDLLPGEAQKVLRPLFRQYLEARLRSYEAIMADVPGYRAELGRLQGEIWTKAEVACRQVPGPPVTIVVLPAINEMIDITTTREMVAMTRVPGVIITLLFAVSLISALLAGYAMSTWMRRSWLHMILFAAIIAISIYVILDLENPRIGLIRLDAADVVLQHLLEKIN
jgi:hypothetical protein